MASIRKRGRFPLVLLVLILFLVLTAAIAGSAYYIYQFKVTEIQKENDEKIQDLRYQLYLLNREAYIPKEEIKYGTILTPELFDKVNIKLETSQDLLLDETDMGKINTITLPAGNIVFKSMVSESKLENDIREVEFNMFLIQSNQEKGDFVDVRITFPNGESYIVLSKKQLKGLNLKENTIWLWLDESEILNISSAIIDAYINSGSKLHVTTYILPEMQEAAIPFYPANTDVLDLMKRDPNILKKASDTLAREARAILENHMSMMNTTDLNDVSSGVEEEKGKNKKLIEEMLKGQSISQDSDSNKTNESGEENNSDSSRFQ